MIDREKIKAELEQDNEYKKRYGNRRTYCQELAELYLSGKIVEPMSEDNIEDILNNWDADFIDKRQAIKALADSVGRVAVTKEEILNEINHFELYTGYIGKFNLSDKERLAAALMEKFYENKL